MSESASTAKGIVKNPLTVIAIFAGLAEVSATIALPRLNENVQSTFVWFVMGFPTFLVSLFFLTLWARHHVLYAPSDFSDEDNFMKHWMPSPPEFSEEVSIPESENENGEELAPPSEPETSEQITHDLPTKSDLEPPKEAQSDRMRMMLSRRAEDLAIRWVTSELKLKFVRDVALNGHKDLRYDAIAYGPNGPVIIEVKTLFKSGAAFKTRFIREIHRIQHLINTLNKSELFGATLILFFVSEESFGFDRVQDWKKWAHDQIMKRGIPITVEIEFATLNELELRAAH